VVILFRLGLAKHSEDIAIRLNVSTHFSGMRIALELVHCSLMANLEVKGLFIIFILMVDCLVEVIIVILVQ